MSKIFVSIASYRDPELLPTLHDLISNAANPSDLVICIAWQHSKKDKWDTLKKYKNDRTNNANKIAITTNIVTAVRWFVFQVRPLYCNVTCILFIQYFIKQCMLFLYIMIFLCQALKITNYNCKINSILLLL